jgi:hypothetical protein
MQNRFSSRFVQVELGARKIYLKLWIKPSPKTRFIGTLLSHKALAWFRDVLERLSDLLANYSLFVSEFRTFFDDPNSQRHAADALGRLKQGRILSWLCY